MKTSLKLFSLILITAFAGCTNQPNVSQAPSKTEVISSGTMLNTNLKSCICPKMWVPVCGENQKTYGNTCEANCAGVKYTQGQCEKTK